MDRNSYVNGKLVTLTKVETLAEAEVIISMLSAYGIYAYLPVKARGGDQAVDIVDSDFEDARALLTASEASQAE